MNTTRHQALTTPLPLLIIILFACKAIQPAILGPENHVLYYGTIAALLTFALIYILSFFNLGKFRFFLLPLFIFHILEGPSPIYNAYKAGTAIPHGEAITIFTSLLSIAIVYLIARNKKYHSKNPT